MATVTFLGAAKEVTGSCHLLESPSIGRILLDCGMHQGGDAVDRIKKDNFEFAPHSIDGVILSHAHLDHSGLLPKLVHNGFDGPIYCTSPTADLLSIMLYDAHGIYERDLERENQRRQKRGRKLLEPEYTETDVKKVLKLCRHHPYKKSIPVSSRAKLVFHDAGHILGSAIVELRLEEDDQEKILVFSGDLGKQDSMLMNNPAVLTRADTVIMEGTYGDRNHRSLDNTLIELEQILRETWDRGGNVMIPAFAVGRTQEIIFHLGCLHHAGKLDGWQVFLDSPMAIAVTQSYDRWLHILDSEDIRHLSEAHRKSLAEFLPQLQLTSSTEDSIAINSIDSGAIIIAGSGMCTGGRIRQHFKHRIWQEKNTVIFVGFQAQGTLGRLLVDGLRQVKLFQRDYEVRATIETLGSFSAHAGQQELLAWLAAFNPPPQTILVHGEEAKLEALAAQLQLEQEITAVIPGPGDSVQF